jgi:hypothetical protein
MNNRLDLTELNRTENSRLCYTGYRCVSASQCETVWKTQCWGTGKHLGQGSGAGMDSRGAEEKGTLGELLELSGKWGGGCT